MNVIRFFLCLTITVVSFFKVAGQNIPFTHSYGYFGAEEGFGIVEAADSGYVLCGQTGSFTNGQSDVFLVKISINGQLEWAKNIGFYNSEGGRSIAQVPGGGYLLAGYGNSFGNGGYDVLIIRTDENGDTLFTRHYGGGDWDFADKIIPLSDGNFLVVGKTYSFGAGGSDAYFLKINAQGDTLFTKTLGSAGDQAARDILEYQPGKVAICGYGTFFENTGEDVFLASLDHVNNMWDFETVATLPGAQEGHALVKFPGGRFVVVGNSKPGPHYAPASFFFNTAGNYVDQTLLGGPTLNEYLYTAHLYGADQMVVAGKWIPVGANNFSDAVYYRLNDSGFFLEGGVVSNSGENVARQMIVSSDGGVVAVGTSEGLGPGLSGVLVWKLDNTLAGSTSPSPVLGIGETDVQTETIQIMPNPVRDFFQVFIPADEGVKTLSLTDAQGRNFSIPFSFQESEVGLLSSSLSSFSDGVYFLQVELTSGKVLKQRIIKAGNE
jgi:hypothetical protein